jgi:DNA recombination protein RmuC
LEKRISKQKYLGNSEPRAKLYDKFVGFIENLEKIGKNIDNSRNAYNDAFKQLKSEMTILFYKLKN